MPKNQGDFGILLDEGLSAIADKLAKLQDTIAQEALLDTSRHRPSTVEHQDIIAKLRTQLIQLVMMLDELDEETAKR